MNIFEHKIWFILLLIFLVAGGLYVCILSIIMVFQSRFIFFPGDEITATPGEIGLSYVTVNLETDDGVKLSGWFIPARNERGVVLFCHGNAGNISHRLKSIQIFHDLGLSTFIFDYRGYGLSEGKTTEQGACRLPTCILVFHYLFENRLKSLSFAMKSSIETILAELGDEG